MFYPASLSFRIEEEIKSLPFKQKLKEYIITILALQEMLKVLLMKNKKAISRNKKI